MGWCIQSSQIMDSEDRIGVSAAKLATAIESLKNRPLQSHDDIFSTFSADASPQQGSFHIDGGIPGATAQARRSALSAVNTLQNLLQDPSDFLQQLAKQNQVLNCLQWLGEFQVLACIPVNGCILIKDLAELAGVPEDTLCRIVRLMAVTTDFLHEPQPGLVTHSTLSSAFVTKPSLLDAAMFLAETSAPTASRMAAATRRFGASQLPTETAFNVAFEIPLTFPIMCEQRTKLQRQWIAYLRYATGDIELALTSLLFQFDWASVGCARVVDVGARTTTAALALTDHYPALQLIVQTTESRTNSPTRGSPASAAGSSAKPVGNSLLNSESRWLNTANITVQSRTLGTPQTIPNAAIYILRLPQPLVGASSNTISEQIAAELRAHLDVLRTNSGASLILVQRVMPEPKLLDSGVEAVLRLRDLSLFQLAGEKELETAELIQIVNGVGDDFGQLVSVQSFCANDNPMIGLQIRYQVYGS